MFDVNATPIWKLFEAFAIHGAAYQMNGLQHRTMVHQLSEMAHHDHAVQSCPSTNLNSHAP